jgi:uncharacterized membrane protein YhaH (DUF805 family)
MNPWVKTALLPTTRIGRAPYLALLGVAGLPFGAANSLNLMLFSARINGGGLDLPSELGSVLTLLGLALTIWLGFCAMANRLHDFGKSAAWVITPAIVLAGLVWLAQASGDYSFQFLLSLLLVFALPLAAFIVAIALAVFPSTPGDNKFGPLGGMILAPQTTEAPAGDVAPPLPTTTAIKVKVIDVLLRPTLRLSRSGFWAAWLIMSATSMAFGVVLTLAMIPLHHVIPDSFIGGTGRWLFMGLALAPALWMQFCVCANRLHDINYRAAWLIAPVGVYIVASLVVSLGDFETFKALLHKGRMLLFGSYVCVGLVLAFIKGSDVANSYGPPTSLILR